MQHNYGNSNPDTPIIRFLLSGKINLSEIASVLSEDDFKRQDENGNKYYSLTKSTKNRIYLEEYLACKRGAIDRLLTTGATKEEIDDEQRTRNSVNRMEYERRYGISLTRKIFDANPSAFDFFS